MHFKVTFHLDGSGLIYDPNEPIHLDALLCWAMAPRQGVHQEINRDTVPEHVGLTLERQYFGPHWVWKASALFPEGPQGEDLQFWRKRFRQGRAELSEGSPSLTNSTYRDWQMPTPLLLTNKLVAYAHGSRKEAKRLLRDVTHLGKKRAHGHGKVIGLDLDEVERDYSLLRDGCAMRWLPLTQGDRQVRLRPPYWNRHERVPCCEVGDSYPDITFPAVA